MNKNNRICILICVLLYALAASVAFTNSTEKKSEVQSEASSTDPVEPQDMTDTNEKAVVQIQTRNMSGSGVIYKMEPDELIILTAAHLLTDFRQVCLVTFIDGLTVSCNEAFVIQETDVAFLAVPYETPNGNDEKDTLADHLHMYQSVRIEKEISDNLIPGDKVKAIGSIAGVAKEKTEGTVAHTFIFTRDFNQHMMIANMDVSPGMSGAGLFDEQGFFLGIIAGTGLEENGQRTAVIPLSIINAGEILLKECNSSAFRLNWIKKS